MALEKLTIVIPTYNRPDYALRNMRYWSGRGPQVIVLDGSDTPIDDAIINSLGSNITYLHKAISINERLLLAVNFITTPYAMLCGDDEFMVPSGVLDCIHFLDSNLDYTACCGSSIGFIPRGKFLRLFPEKLGHRKHYVNQENSIDRIKYHIENYNVTTIYGVHRTESFVFCLTNSCNISYSCPYVSEHLFELLAAAFGKSTILPSPSWLRSSENQPVSTAVWDREILLPDWYDDPENADEVKHMYDVVTEAVTSLDESLVEKKAREVIVAATEGRIAYQRHRYRGDGKDSLEYIRESEKQRRSTIAYRIAMAGYLLAIQLMSFLLFRKIIDIRHDFYSSKSCYSFRMLAKLDVKINEISEKELVEVLDKVLAFHAR